MRRHPFRELESFLQELPARDGSGRVAADLAESDDAFTVTMDLPGFETDDIDIRVTDHTLHVEADHEEETAEDEEFIRRERRHRSVSRTVHLPESVDEEGAEATYRNGVVTVTIPKTHEHHEEEHRVPVA